MVDIYLDPKAVDVSQFGADNANVGRYKQAAEYAAEAEYWSKLAQSKIGTLDALMQSVQDLYNQGVLLEKDIEDLKADFANQDARLMALISDANTAASNANNAVLIINQKIADVQKQLDILKQMKLTVHPLPSGSTPSGSYDNTTGEMILNIPDGAPGTAGKDGSVTDLNNTTSGVPKDTDIGFYVDATTNTVHKATMLDIAKVYPAVSDITFNGGTPETHTVDITPTKIGLGNVLNVPSYSKTEADALHKGSAKAYESKADADADVVHRQVGEKVIVITPTRVDYYIVKAGALITDPNVLEVDPNRPGEVRVLSVSGTHPDATGDVDIQRYQGNPSLYVGEILMFPYNPDKEYSQPGLSPADGSTVLAANYDDLLARLKAGDLPVVSETEWQAGAKSFFSWGKLADGTTDADATNCINIRLPDWRTGEAMRSPDVSVEGTGAGKYDGKFKPQNEYIKTVNSKAPDDANGDITISANDLNAVSKSGDSITGSLSVSAQVEIGDTLTVKGANTFVNGLTHTSENSSQWLTGSNKTAQINYGTNSDGANFHFTKYDVASGNALFNTLLPMDGGTVYTTVNKPTLTDLGAAKAGDNSDITKLTGLVGSLRLGADGTSPDDAVTKRQLDLHTGGGSGGATMNGVMTNYIGAVEWFNGSEGTLPAGYVLASGQLLKKADYPDLYQAAASGFLQSIATGGPRASDLVWQVGEAGAVGLAKVKHRGKYSFIPAGSTPYNESGGALPAVSEDTFRVPDLNGKQPGGIGSMFLRGSGGVTAGTNALIGEVHASAAPNIEGILYLRASTDTTKAYPSAVEKDGAFTGVTGMPSAQSVIGGPAQGIALGANAVNSNVNQIDFKASGSNDAYGREGSNEVRPNAATGVWIIRAKATFEAQDTNFHVIVNDSTASTGKRTGGSFVSDYSIGGVTRVSADFHVYQNGADGSVGAEVNILNSAGALIRKVDLTSDPIVYTWRQAQTEGWVTFHANTSSADDSLLVIVEQDRITIEGLHQATGGIASTDIMYKINKMPQGKTSVRKPFCQISAVGTNTSLPVTGGGGGTITLGSSVAFSAQATSIANGVSYGGWLGAGDGIKASGCVVTEHWYFS